MIKTKDDIVKELITDTVAQTDKITYFGRDSAIKAIYSSIANVIYEVWNDLFQIKRQIQLQTATGTDLEEIAARHGITRNAEAKSTAIILFEGESGTIVPAGTIVRTAGEISYITLNEIVIGNKNSQLVRPLPNNFLGDAVLAESTKKGSGTRVGVNELTFCTLQGITSCTNLLPSVGGNDTESDEELRNRIYEKNDSLAQGTISFYQAIAKQANNEILRSKAFLDYKNYGVKLYLLKNSLGLFTANDLNDISNTVYEKQKALTPVSCSNAELLGIDFEISIEVKNGFTFDEVFRNIASDLTNYFDVSTQDFGALIKYYDVVNVISRVEGVKNVQDVFMNNSKIDIQAGNIQIPRLRSVTLHDYNEDNSIIVELSYLVV